MPLEAAIIVAVLAQGVLTLLLYVWLGRKRLPRISDGSVRIEDIALDKDNWPDDARQANFAVESQFQLPVLFYVASALTLVLWPGWLDIALALAFVVSRYVHAWIYVTTNNVPRRFQAFVVGYVLICLWWLVLIVRLILRLASGV